MVQADRAILEVLEVPVGVGAEAAVLAATQILGILKIFLVMHNSS